MMKLISNILVVGGSGFIGSYLMQEIGADNLDLKQGKDVRDGINEWYDCIILLACDQSDTQEAYIYNNEIYIAVDKYMKQYPDTRVIFASSAAVYPMLGHYAQSKILGEAYVKRYQNHVILRLFNVYGHGDGHGAPDRFLRGETVINGDGHQSRDIIPVETVVHAIKQHIGSERSGTFDVCTGCSVTVNAMFRRFGKGVPSYKKDGPVGVMYSSAKPGEVYETN